MSLIIEQNISFDFYDNHDAALTLHMSAAKVIKETSRSRNGMSLPLLSKFEHDCLKTWDSAHQAWSTVFMGAYKHFHTSAHWQPEKHPRRRPSEGPYIGGSKNQNASYPYIGTLSLHRRMVHTSERYPYIGEWSVHRNAIHTLLSIHWRILHKLELRCVDHPLMYGHVYTLPLWVEFKYCKLYHFFEFY